MASNNPTAIRYQLPASDAEICRTLNVNEKILNGGIKHEVDDASDRTEIDVYYDAVALSFLLEVVPLFYSASSSSSTSQFTISSVAEQVHATLSRHLEANKKVPIQLPADYPRECVPHLRSTARRLWVYLIRGVVLNTDIPVSEQTLRFVAAFLKQFFVYARSQPSWSTWEAQTDDDLRLSWVLGDWLGESPPWYPETANGFTEEYKANVEAYNRSVKFSAYLVREGFPYHVSFYQSFVFAFGKAGGSGLPGDPKATDNAILALPAVVDIAGDVLYKMCFGKLGGDEKLAELEREISRSNGSLAEYSEENWKHWRQQAYNISSSPDRRIEVASAAKHVEEKMGALEMP